MADIAPRTFDFRSARDMLGKLERELKRLASSTERPEIADHALNAAMTAWHLTDWVWQEVERSPGLRSRLAAEFDVSTEKFNRERFNEVVKGACPELRYCRIICIQTKHLNIRDIHTGDPVFTTGVAPAEVMFVNHEGQPITFTNEHGQPIAWTSQAWDLWIVDDDGSRRHAAEVLEAAFYWWTQFIYGHQIDEQ